MISYTCEDCNFYEEEGGCENNGAKWNRKKNEWTPTSECAERGHIQND